MLLVVLQVGAKLGQRSRSTMWSETAKASTSTTSCWVLPTVVYSVRWFPWCSSVDWMAGSASAV